MSLDDILGQVLEQASGSSGSRSAGGGGLGDILSQLGGGTSRVGGAQGGAAGMGAVVGMLAPLIARFLRDGGLEKLLGSFSRAGKGQQAQSWVGTGANEAITAEDVDQALSAEEIDEVARELGVSHEQASALLADVLPGVVDAVTPTGRVPGAEELEGRLG